MENLAVLGWMAMEVVFAEETVDMVQLPLAANTDYEDLLDHTMDYS
jgi:hypothetical protein